jgi:hypothetical protein
MSPFAQEHAFDCFKRKHLVLILEQLAKTTTIQQTVEIRIKLSDLADRAYERYEFGQQLFCVIAGLVYVRAPPFDPGTIPRSS